MAGRQQWHVRSLAVVFVKCLHLLELHLLKDCPKGIEQIFSPKTSIQQRIKFVEWSLYRLFEQYDPKLCQEKLSPFFPPTTSLQSLNLRAALFRQLSELKKDGSLDPNTQLRRTMLDECKGEKFEESIAAFAMVVLRKVKAVTDQGLRASHDHVNSLPLILAYRKSLQKSLNERNMLRNSALQTEKSSKVSLEILDDREYEIKSSLAEIEKPKSERLHSLVQVNWLGHDSWVEIVFNGHTPSSDESTEHLSLAVHATGENGQQLMTELENTIQNHQEKLRDWKATLERLKKRSPTTFPPKDQTLGRDQTKRFTGHQRLHSSPVKAVPIHPRYDRLLSSIDAELLDTRKEKGFKRAAESTGLKDSKVHSVGVDKLHEIDENELGENLNVRSKTDCSVELAEESTQVAKTQQVEERLGTHDQEGLQSGFPKREMSSLIASHSKSSTVYATPALSVEVGDVGSKDAVVEAHPQQCSSQKHLETPPKSAESTNSSSLLERTRQSMLFFSRFSPDGPSVQNLEQQTSTVHVPHRLETLTRSRTSLQPTWITEDTRASTPRDQLFDEDADVTSVFKSRPRLATSPALSPQHNDSLEDSILGAEKP